MAREYRLVDEEGMDGHRKVGTVHSSSREQDRINERHGAPAGSIEPVMSSAARESRRPPHENELLGEIGGLGCALSGLRHLSGDLLGAD